MSPNRSRTPFDDRIVASSFRVTVLAFAPALLLPAFVQVADAAGIDTPLAALSTSGTEPSILLAQAGADAPAAPSDLGLRFGRHDAYDRIVFEWSEPVEVDFSKSGSELVLTFDRGAEAAFPSTEHFTYQADRLPQLVFGLRGEDRGRRYRIDIDPNARFRVHRWNDGHLVVVDVYQPSASDAPDTAVVIDAEPDPETAGSEAVQGATPALPPAETPPGTPDVGVAREEVPEAEEDQDLQEEASDDEVSEQAEDDDDTPDQGDDVDDEVAEDQSYDDEEDEEGAAFLTSGDFELYLGGSLQFGVSTAGGDQISGGEGDRGYTFINDSDITIDAYATVLDDVDVGASVSLEADADVADGVNADSAYVYFDNGFGQVQLGRTSGAEDDMALGADTIAAGTGGIDGDAVNLGDTQVETSGDAAKVSYFTPRLSGFQAGVSYTPDTGDDETDNDDGGNFENYVGLGLNYVETYGDVELSLATVGSFSESETSSDDKLGAFALGGTVDYDALSFGASYGRSASDIFFDYTFATVGVTLGIDEASAGIGYNVVDEKSDGVTHIFVLSGDTPILPGVTLQGDVSFADPENDDGNVASVLAVELGF